MSPAPNQLYSAFSFIGFVLCTIPFYWHLEGTWVYLRDSSTVFKKFTGTAWNTGTCLYMIWTGVGCLMQCINSIVWNGNIINRVPVYCDICKSLDPLSLQRLLTLPSPHSNSYSSRIECCYPGMLTLHQSPPLQDRFGEGCDDHTRGEAPGGDTRFADLCRHSASPDDFP